MTATEDQFLLPQSILASQQPRVPQRAAGDTQVPVPHQSRPNWCWSKRGCRWGGTQWEHL